MKKVKVIETLCKDGYETGYLKNKNYEFKREDNVVSLLSKGNLLCRLVITGYEQGQVEEVNISNRFEANAVTTFVQYFGLDSVYTWEKNTYTVE
ncbi:hypothetical protein [Enterococcus olivae]